MSLLEDLMTLLHPEARTRFDRAASREPDADPIRAASARLRTRLLELAGRAVWEPRSRTVHRIPPGIREDVVQRLLLAIFEKLRYPDAHLERAVGRGSRNPTIRSLRMTDPSVLFAWPRPPEVVAILPEAERQLASYLARTLSRFARAFWREAPLDDPEGQPEQPAPPAAGDVSGALRAAGDAAMRALEAAFACTEQVSSEAEWRARWARLQRVARGQTCIQAVVLEELRRPVVADVSTLDRLLEATRSRCDAAAEEIGAFRSARPDDVDARLRALARVSSAAERLDPEALQAATWALLRDVVAWLGRETSFRAVVKLAAEEGIGDPAIPALSAGPAGLRAFGPSVAWKHVGDHVSAVATSKRLVAMIRSTLIGPQGKLLVPGFQPPVVLATKLQALEAALDDETLAAAVALLAEFELRFKKETKVRNRVDQWHTRVRDRVRRGTRRLAAEEGVTTLRCALGAVAKRTRGDFQARLVGVLRAGALQLEPSELRALVADLGLARAAAPELAEGALKRVLPRLEPDKRAPLLDTLRADPSPELDEAMNLALELADALDALDAVSATRVGALAEHPEFALGDARHVARPPTARETIQLGFATAQRFHPTFSPLFGALACLSNGSRTEELRAAQDALDAFRRGEKAREAIWEARVDGAPTVRAELAEILRDPHETELRAASNSLGALAVELAGHTTASEVPSPTLTADDLWLARFAIDRLLTTHPRARVSDATAPAVRRSKTTSKETKETHD